LNKTSVILIESNREIYVNLSIIALSRGANFAITDVTANIIVRECPISRAEFVRSTCDPITIRLGVPAARCNLRMHRHSNSGATICT